MLSDVAEGRTAREGKGVHTDTVKRRASVNRGAESDHGPVSSHGTALCDNLV
jgi:hypothetical protein